MGKELCCQCQSKENGHAVVHHESPEENTGLQHIATERKGIVTNAKYLNLS